MAVIQVAAVTDKGAVKSTNEDRLFIGGGVLASGSCCIEVEEPTLLAVFDGVSAGGHGAEASSLAAQALAGFEVDAGCDARGLAEAACAVLSQTSREMSATSASWRCGTSMATTTAGIAIAKGEFVTFHAGDSRVYRMRNGFLARQTGDHSVVQQLESIHAPQEQIEWAQTNQAHVILRALGLGPGWDIVDISKAWPVFENDIFLLCSDGLTEGVPDQLIEEMLKGADVDLQTKAVSLFNAALVGGSDDNISVMLVEISTPIDEKES